MPSLRRPLLVMPLVAGLALAAWLGPGGAAADDPQPVAIAEGPPLSWGFKQSWRTYVGAPETSGGASLTAGAAPGDPYGIAWELESGSYDAATGTTELRYRGSVHWRKYYVPDNPALGSPPPGYTGPLDIHRLDVELTDPVVTIGPDAATISVEAVSRDLESWQLQDFGRVDVATLDVSATAPVVAGGTTTWTAVPAFTSEGADAVFAGNYPAGRAVDALTLSYTGPGGAPDLSEDWDAPGSTRLSLTQNSILTADGLATQYSPWWIDRGRRVVHRRWFSLSGDQVLWNYRAFDLDAMQDAGATLTVPELERVGQTSFFDSTGGRLFYGQPGEPAVSRWLRFDAGAGQYVRGAPAAPFPLAGSAGALFWDSVGERAFNVQRDTQGAASNAHDLHQWKLHAYDEQPDGTWTRTSYDLPNFPTGLNQRGYPDGGNGIDAPVGVAARDGSLILLGTRQTSSNGAVPAPATVAGAWRVVLDGGQATVAAIPGTEVENSSSGVFDALRAGPGGQITLFRAGSLGSGIPHVVQTLTVSAAGAVAVGPRTSLGDLDVSAVDAFAVDPEDGTAWVGGNLQQRLVGVKDGQVVADQFVAERHPRGGPVVAGAGHAVHPQTNDGSPAPPGGSPIFGFGRLERLGWSPAIAADPQPAAVELSAGETGEQAHFESAATGTPAPERQWQVKPPGAVRFADLPGETGATLTVDAERGMGGGEYRAVYENAAGRIASEPATLTVDYAPEIAVDVVDATATEGEPATFQVLSQGSPEPEVTWQRRVGGFWQPIAPDDENFELDGGVLTVGETNLDQSGALFRARIANGVATIHSRIAELTVEPATTIPPGGLSLDGVSLDWSGSPELQRNAPNMQPNYLSAGVSDGSEATYAADAAGARVLHVGPGGEAALATWAARGAQTGGALRQLVRLVDGHAEIEPDGAAVVTWDGAFSVNFYGGLVPFSVARPRLTVDADGDGTLTADLSGYGASMADPGDRHPIAPVDDVTLATFSGVEVDPDGAVEIEPDYDGVAVDAPPGFAAQDRASAGWGAWPQPFVDFHAATGLAPYWYSSGGAFDPHKRAEPFSVDFTGAGSVPPPPPIGPSGGPFDPPPPAADRASTTRLTVARTTYGRPARATVRMAVARGGEGAAAGAAGTSGGRSATTAAATTGEVVVRVAGRRVTGALTGGVARLRLPAGIRPGVHRVRAAYAGGPGVAASTARATLRVARATPRVALRVLAPRATHRPPRLAVTARIPGASRVHPTGQLVVRDGARVVRVARLRRSDRGRLRIRLPRLAPGRHFVRVALAGGPLQRAAASPYREVRVRSRP